MHLIKIANAQYATKFIFYYLNLYDKIVEPFCQVYIIYNALSILQVESSRIAKCSVFLLLFRLLRFEAPGTGC